MEQRPGPDCDKSACSSCGSRTSCSGIPEAPPLAETVPEDQKLRQRLGQIRRKIMVMSGKGGVGKSTVATNLAVHLMLEQLGCEVINLGIIPDAPQKLRAAFIEADKSADVVISSGGVSVGEADYTKTLLEELGEIAFWKLAIKPGKPFAFGKLPHSWFCGLPGNPVSAALTFYQLVIPLLAKLSGNNASPLPERVRVRAATRLKKSPGRLDFQRGILARNADGELVASGGRVLGVVAHAASLAQARADAYAAADQLDAPSLFGRRDIAARAERGEITVSDAYRVNSTLTQYAGDVAEGDDRRPTRSVE